MYNQRDLPSIIVKRYMDQYYWGSNNSGVLINKIIGINDYKYL